MNSTEYSGAAVALSGIATLVVAIFIVLAAVEFIGWFTVDEPRHRPHGHACNVAGGSIPGNTCARQRNVRDKLREYGQLRECKHSLMVIDCVPVPPQDL